MKYVYGPVRSRRLGFSLGISTVPYKVCSLDCVYCQLEKTTQKTMKRKEYVKKEEVLEEVKTFFDEKPSRPKIDYVTFSGSGEPTLHQSIGDLIRGVKTMTRVPVALLTNSTTLVDPKVRRDILDADVVIPSLDAVTQDIFEKIDRPLEGVRIEDIIEALSRFRQEFKGKIWLEVMLVRGLNDSPAYLRRIKKITDRLKADRVQLNSPVRPPSEEWVKPVSREALSKAKKIFGDNCDVF